jgi:hypothetical protein
MARAAIRNVGRFQDTAERSEQVTERSRDGHRVVAIGLLTQRDLDILGVGFRRAIPLTGPGEFDELLARIDEADRRWGASD